MQANKNMYLNAFWDFDLELSKKSKTAVIWMTRCDPSPNDQILDWSKVKVFADDKMNIDKLTLSQTSPSFYVSAVRVESFENTVGKGEIARHKQFLLFPQSFLSIWIAFCHFH